MTPFSPWSLHILSTKKNCEFFPIDSIDVARTMPPWSSSPFSAKMTKDGDSQMDVTNQLCFGLPPLSPEITRLKTHAFHSGPRFRTSIKCTINEVSIPCRTTNIATSSASSNIGRKVRVAIPSKGAMFELTRELLDEIGAKVEIGNPRQYVATLRGVSNVEVWLQRPVDIVRKVRECEVDLGFVGLDLVKEYGGNEKQVVAIHENLSYGECRLGVGVPMHWEGVECIDDLRDMGEKVGGKRMRIATKFKNATIQFMRESGISNYEIVDMDGALEASTQMGSADFIVDLISSGTTLRENLLKEIEGGTVLESSMQLVGNRNALRDETDYGRRLRSLTRELLERIEGHLTGKEMYNMIANMRGSSMIDVSRKLASQTDLRGINGPTISPVIAPMGESLGMYAISLVIPKRSVYAAVEQLRKVGGSGVSVLPVTYVFAESSRRWQCLLADLGLVQ